MAIKFNPSIARDEETNSSPIPAGEFTPTASPTAGVNLEFTPDYEYDLDQIILDIRRDNVASPLLMKVNTKSELGERVIAIVINEILIDHNLDPEDPSVDPTSIPNFQTIFNDTLQSKYELLTEAQRRAFIEGALVLDDRFKSRVTTDDITTALNARSIGHTEIVWRNLSADETEESDLSIISHYENKIETIYQDDNLLSIVDKSVNLKINRSAIQVSESTIFLLTDINKLVICQNSEPISLTISNDLEVDFPLYSEVNIIQYGEGTIAIVGGTDVTINSRTSNYTITGRYGRATIKKMGPNEWTIYGDI